MAESSIKLSEKNKDFFEAVYQVVRLIPKGRVSSYGAIASFLGAKNGARMVGWAMNASHQQKEYVPAHRVVNRLGMLSGKHHFSDVNFMQNALESEGIEVINDQIQNFNSLFWNPIEEIGIE